MLYPWVGIMIRSAAVTAMSEIDDFDGRIPSPDHPLHRSARPDPPCECPLETHFKVVLELRCSGQTGYRPRRPALAASRPAGQR